MPTDVSSAVNPEYTAAIPVPLDGEYANSTALQNMVLPLANRIEYVRALVQDQPWIRAGFFDDFGMDLRVIDSALKTYMADTPWFASNDPSTSGFQVLNIGDSSGYGVVRHRNSGGGIAAHYWRKSLALLGSASAVQRFVARVRPNSIATGMRCDIGITSGNFIDAVGNDQDNGLTFAFNPATSANWQLRTDNGVAVSTFQASGVPVVAGTWYTLECRYTGSLASFYIDGVFQFSTNTTLPAPGVNTTFKIGLQTPNSGADREWLLDYVMLECDFAGRTV